jgi:hypothetical protein
MRAAESSRLRIVVLGYVVRGPLGGLAWHYLQYVLGLVKLGHDVFFVEQSADDYPSCYDPANNTFGTDPTYGLAFAAEAFRALGVADRWAFFDAAGGRWHGPLANSLRSIESADMCLNVSGATTIPDALRAIPVRVFIDTDPAFTQVRHLTDEWARRRADDHNVFFTFAENLPAGRAEIPDDGRPWQPTRQPIVLDAWPVRPPQPRAKYTSVLLWDSYGAVEHAGKQFGPKSESFAPFYRLPERAGRQFELALGSPSAPCDYLRSVGWDVVDPLPITRDLFTYQRYIEASKGEFGIAKHGYVSTDSGWFSERSACYLASGRPVVVQDTGFSAWLATGEGVVPFSTPEEAVAAIAEVNGRYARHCQRAREIAASYFDSNKVLPDLLNRAMATSGNPVAAQVCR